MNLVTPATHCSTQATRPVLGYFVMASLLLHLLLVGLWQGETPVGPSAHSTFLVTLLARHGDAASEPRNDADQAVPARTPELVMGAAKSDSAAAPVMTERVQRPVTRLLAVAGLSSNTSKEREARVKTETRRATVKELPSHTQQNQVSARNGSTSHGLHELTSSARYHRTRSALLEALLPHFDYPPLARRRGWQGLVNVGLHVAADGELTRIRLVESSGHALLDRAAVRGITALRGIPVAAQWLEGYGMDVVLPVRYQLAD